MTNFTAITPKLFKCRHKLAAHSQNLLLSWEQQAHSHRTTANRLKHNFDHLLWLPQVKKTFILSERIMPDIHLGMAWSYYLIISLKRHHDVWTIQSFYWIVLSTVHLFTACTDCISTLSQIALVIWFFYPSWRGFQDPEKVEKDKWAPSFISIWRLRLSPGNKQEHY